MSNYPFDTFPLTKRVGIVNPVANLDARYGPWPTFNDALTGFSSLIRHVGLTVAVTGVGGITEYWYKNGIADNNLVLKIAEGSNFGSLSGKYEDVSTTFMSNSANYILDGGNTKGSNITIGTNDNFNINFETNNTTRAVLNNSGNLGIGFSNPTDRLEVNGAIKIGGSLPSIRTTTNRFSVNETSSLPGNETGMVTQFSSGGFGRSIFAITHTGVNTTFFGLNSQLFSIGGEGDTDIRFVKGLSYSATDILNSGTETMRIRATDGFVGIGTNNPNYLLTVAGDISANLVRCNNIVPQVLELPANLPRFTNNVVDITKHSVVYQTVSDDNFYSLQNYTLGSTLTLHISGNHDTLKRHRLLVDLPSAQIRLQGAGQSNEFYTFKNHITKVTLQRIRHQPFDIAPVIISGTAEIIRFDINDNEGGLGFLKTQQESGPTDFLLQENGDRLVFRNFV